MLMVTKCTLWPYLADIDRQANEMYDLLIEQMKEAEGVTEELKELDQLEWVTFSNERVKLFAKNLYIHKNRELSWLDSSRFHY